MYFFFFFGGKKDKMKAVMVQSISDWRGKLGYASGALLPPLRYGMKPQDSKVGVHAFGS